jgi:hypothetical protein
VEILKNLGKFATGTGQSTSVYRDGSPQAREMATAPGVTNARALFIRMGCPSSGVMDYGASFGLVGGAPVAVPHPHLPLAGQDGLLDAGLNPTRQYTGSYDVNIARLPDGRIVIHVNNTTSGESLVLGWGFEWERGAFNLPFGNTRQSITWAEPNPCR